MTVFNSANADRVKTISQFLHQPPAMSSIGANCLCRVLAAQTGPMGPDTRTHTQALGPVLSSEGQAGCSVITKGAEWLCKCKVKGDLTGDVFGPRLEMCRRLSRA